MLDAFVRKHVRRILTTRDHNNNKNEDAITSMVFTPLRFMSAVDALTCIQAFLMVDHFVQSRTPAKHRIELWPRDMTASGWSNPRDTSCEPDLLATFDFEAGPSLALLGEMKWATIQAAALSKEMARQAEALGKIRTASISQTFRFAIVKNKPLFDARRIDCDSIQTWERVHQSLRILKARSSGQPAVFQWASLVAEFLEDAEQLIFEGFDFNYRNLPSLSEPRVFFQRNESTAHA